MSNKEQWNNELLLLHPCNGLFSRTTWVSWHQKGKRFWILLNQQMTGWQWHQLVHMQIICTALHTDNDHASTSPLSFYRTDALPATQPTASKHWRSLIMPKCYQSVLISCNVTNKFISWLLQPSKRDATSSALGAQVGGLVTITEHFSGLGHSRESNRSDASEKLFCNIGPTSRCGRN